MNLNCLYYDMVFYISFLCLFIGFLIFFFLVGISYFISGNLKISSENHFIEFLWTFIPSLWILIFCIFNLNFLIADKELLNLSTIKIVGRQWYWSYEYNNLNYDSIMGFLVNTVDQPLYLKYGFNYRLLVSSFDVIHSFSIPDLGLKIDAVPGRINQVLIVPFRLGIFIGYCSELCGAGHSYMPLVIEVIK
uniref:Cytochrome c oxidase subunit 2 n=1 Tax=Paratetraonchoides inermis TaxID=2048240 RepID=A0A2D1GRS7_9PLAT|nr:cytochrome c oxidase subunit II [Paratetraonchoides inermis]ATN95418.1 cytochrome c oxidase subunit 2 [Paratetraonchoides inermis]